MGRTWSSMAMPWLLEYPILAMHHWIIWWQRTSAENLWISALCYNTENRGSSSIWRYFNKGTLTLRREGLTAQKARGSFLLLHKFVQGTSWHLLCAPSGSIPKAKQAGTRSAGESQQGLGVSKLLTDHHCWESGSSKHVLKWRNLCVVRTGLMGIKSHQCI